MMSFQLASWCIVYLLSDESIRQVIGSGQDEAIFKLICDELVLIYINFKDISNRVTFDTK